MNTDDIEQYTVWMNDLSITSKIGNCVGNVSLAYERNFVEGMAKSGQNYAIVFKATDKLIGNISLEEIDSIHRTSEIGLFIGDEEYQGKGYGREALELMLAYGFKVLNLHNIILKVYSFNEHAIRAYAKLGFKIIGRRRESYYLNGMYHDEVFMDLLSTEFHSDLLDSKLPL